MAEGEDQAAAGDIAQGTAGREACAPPPCSPVDSSPPSSPSLELSRPPGTAECRTVSPLNGLLTHELEACEHARRVGSVPEDAGENEQNGVHGDELSDEVMVLYQEIGCDAKAFAANMLAERALSGVVEGDQGAAGELRLSEELVEGWICEQMVREGCPPEDVEKERMMVRENRQGDRRDGALEKDLPDSDGGEGVGAIGDHVSDSYAAREVDGGEGGGGLDGDGGLWWGARRWDEEAADDVWCVADSVVAALAQLLRAEVCLYGQHFAAKTLPALVNMGACRGAVEMNADLMAAAATALRHCCKAVILAATEVRAHSDEKGAAVEEGAVAEAERGETKKNDQREMVALGGAVHLTLGVLRIARLSQHSCVLLIKEGAVPALCDALVLRVNNPVGPRLHEAAALAVGVLASHVSSSPPCRSSLGSAFGALVKLCGHSMRHIHTLSRLHHKKLVATSRVVSAACVSTCVLRHVVLDAAATVTDVEGAGCLPHHGMVGGCAGQGPDIAAAAAVFGNLELEALSHVLHNLKGLVYQPGTGRKLAESCRGWRVLLFLRALQAAMDQEDAQRAGAVTGWEREGAVGSEQTSGTERPLFVRLGDRDMLHLFVALAVDEGGVGAIQREGKEGGAREADESEEAREAAESILMTLVEASGYIMPAHHSRPCTPSLAAHHESMRPTDFLGMLDGFLEVHMANGSRRAQRLLQRLAVRDAKHNLSGSSMGEGNAMESADGWRATAESPVASPTGPIVSSEPETVAECMSECTLRTPDDTTGPQHDPGQQDGAGSAGPGWFRTLADVTRPATGAASRAAEGEGGKEGGRGESKTPIRWQPSWWATENGASQGVSIPPDDKAHSARANPPAAPPRSPAPEPALKATPSPGGMVDGVQDMRRRWLAPHATRSLVTLASPFDTALPELESSHTVHARERTVGHADAAAGPTSPVALSPAKSRRDEAQSLFDSFSPWQREDDGVERAWGLGRDPSIPTSPAAAECSLLFSSKAARQGGAAAAAATGSGTPPRSPVVPPFGLAATPSKDVLQGQGVWELGDVWVEGTGVANVSRTSSSRWSGFGAAPSPVLEFSAPPGKVRLGAGEGRERPPSGRSEVSDPGGKIKMALV